MEQARPIITTATRLTVVDYQRVVEMARNRGLVTGGGRPNVSAAIRTLVAQALDAGPKQRDQAQQGQMHG